MLGPTMTSILMTSEDRDGPRMNAIVAEIMRLSREHRLNGETYGRLLREIDAAGGDRADFNYLHSEAQRAGLLRQELDSTA